MRTCCLPKMQIYKRYILSPVLGILQDWLALSKPKENGNLHNIPVQRPDAISMACNSPL